MALQQEGGTLGDDEVPAEIGRRMPGPYDYTGIVRELSNAQRVVLHLIGLETCPEEFPDVTEDRRELAQANAIMAAQSNVRNALRVLERRREELREKYNDQAAARPCELYGSADGVGVMVSCATHRAMWREPGGEGRCPNATDDAVAALLLRAGWSVQEEK